MHPDLEALRQQLESSRSRGHQFIETLTPEQINWRYAAGSWSIAECLAHMTTTSDLYAKAIEEALAKKSQTTTPGAAFRYGWLESFFLRQVEPPVKLKVKAPDRLQPGSNLDLEQVRSEWEASHQKLFQLLSKSDGVALNRVKVQSPVSRFVRLSLGIALQVIAAHNRRHLWQADQLRAKREFPALTREEGSQS